MKIDAFGLFGYLAMAAFFAFEIMIVFSIWWAILYLIARYVLRAQGQQARLVLAVAVVMTLGTFSLIAINSAKNDRHTAGELAGSVVVNCLNITNNSPLKLTNTLVSIMGSEYDKIVNLSFIYVSGHGLWTPDVRVSGFYFNTHSPQDESRVIEVLSRHSGVGTQPIKSITKVTEAQAKAYQCS